MFIPWFINYPYQNDEIMNLDWLLKNAQINGEKIDNFINLNTIKYADPILWDITSQYEANTVVIDPQTGDAYISTKPVPYGAHLNNTDYWTIIYNYPNAINTLEEQIAIANEKLSPTATAARSVDDLVWLNGLLYVVTAPMIAGDSYVPGSNVAKITIEEILAKLQIDIGNEASARTAADTALGGRITDEAEARANADTALGQRVTDEATARSNADTALGQRITDEATARSNADTALGQRITDEATARANADNALGGRIDNLIPTLNKVNSLTQRHIILLGDSYVQGVGGTTKNIETVMESLYPWDVRRFYGGGSGYLRENVDNKKAVDILQDAIAGTSDKDIITDIVFAWSIYNDMGAVSDPDFNLNGIKTQMDAMQALVKANFPHARVTVCPGLWVNVNYNSNFSKLAKWITTAAEYIGANVGYNAINWLIFESDVASSDNVHPNDNGMQLLGEYICQVLNGSSPEFQDFQNIQSNFTGSSYNVSVRNGIATVRGIITKPSGASTTSIGNLPNYFKFFSNVPILLQPYGNYNVNDTHYGLIIGNQIGIASDQLTAGTMYLMEGTFDLFATF